MKLHILLLCIALVCCQSAHVVLWQTSDIHGWVDGHASSENAKISDFLSLVQREKAHLDIKGIDHMLFDSGDQIQGTGLSDASAVEGTAIYDVLSHVPYDGMTMGNHEIFNPPTVTYVRNHKAALFPDGRYITTNTFWGDAPFNNSPTREPIGNQRYRLITLPHSGIRVLVLGLLFPMPDHQYDNAFISSPAAAVSSSWMANVARSTRPDVVVLLCHMASTDHLVEEVHRAIRSVDGMQHAPLMFLSGHSHILRHKACDHDTQCLISEPSCYFHLFVELDLSLTLKNIAHKPTWQLEETPVPKAITCSLKDFRAAVPGLPADFSTPDGRALATRLKQDIDKLDLDRVIGHSPKHYRRHAVLSASDSLISLFIHKVWPQAILTDPGHVYIMNGLNIRSDMPAGPLTYGTVIGIQPFRFKLVSAHLTKREVEVIMNLDHPGEFAVPHFIISRPVAALKDGKTYTVVFADYEVSVFGDAIKKKTGKRMTVAPYKPAMGDVDTTQVQLWQAWIGKYMPKQ